ncbi:DUF960 family protein [Holzapfeliella floricola]|uniref:DUF960 domain-containing protein n=1 Tax=Holzapfeliella floricola DSM 23037 = JCM 16512 TaxID=1423744 RepID=A0A0R2DPQ5_9LACO|nr:DUF960 family protein [Holzapfeliella floricola]KRN03781.1 hypothetical protein FC86_GL000893 [Holzapfeliella floricola DSM 23037 = JCM 16512]
MTFNPLQERYASIEVMETLPEELIHLIWETIDNQLSGLVPLENLLTFTLFLNNQTQKLKFVQPGTDLEVDFDLKKPFLINQPLTVLAYDADNHQTLLFENELKTP